MHAQNNIQFSFAFKQKILTIYYHSEQIRNKIRDCSISIEECFLNISGSTSLASSQMLAESSALRSHEKMPETVCENLSNSATENVCSIQIKHCLR